MPTSAARRQRYFLPLTLAWEDGQDTGALRTAEWTLAKVREHARAGVLIDAFADPAFCLGLVHCTCRERDRAVRRRRAAFRATGEVPCARRRATAQSINHVGADATNTSVILDDKLFLKAYRRVEAGPNPDVEMTSFLTRAGYRSIAPLAGSVTHVAGETPPCWPRCSPRSGIRATCGTTRSITWSASRPRCSAQDAAASIAARAVH